MALRHLDHVNVRTAQLTEMKRFYVEVMGLALGPRPALDFGGAWLYCGERPVVHLVEVATPPRPEGDLRLEHFAFAADDRVGFLARLDRLGVPYRVGGVPDFGLVQVHLRDPDGNHLHVDFSAAEGGASSPPGG